MNPIEIPHKESVKYFLDIMVKWIEDMRLPRVTIDMCIDFICQENLENRETVEDYVDYLITKYEVK